MRSVAVLRGRRDLQVHRSEERHLAALSGGAVRRCAASRSARRPRALARSATIVSVALHCASYSRFKSAAVNTRSVVLSVSITVALRCNWRRAQG